MKTTTEAMGAGMGPQSADISPGAVAGKIRQAASDASTLRIAWWRDRISAAIEKNTRVFPQTAPFLFWGIFALRIPPCVQKHRHALLRARLVLSICIFAQYLRLFVFWTRRVLNLYRFVAKLHHHVFCTRYVLSVRLFYIAFFLTALCPLRWIQRPRNSAANHAKNSHARLQTSPLKHTKRCKSWRLMRRKHRTRRQLGQLISFLPGR